VPNIVYLGPLTLFVKLLAVLFSNVFVSLWCLSML
jgi:hypothetical protein